MNSYINIINNSMAIQFSILLLISIIVFLISKKILTKFLNQLFKRTSTQIDDKLVARFFYSLDISYTTCYHK